jgi:hypothetical protein
LFKYFKHCFCGLNKFIQNRRLSAANKKNAIFMTE